MAFLAQLPKKIWNSGLNPTVKKVLLGVAVAGAAVKFGYEYNKESKRAVFRELSKDKVILHQMERGIRSPNTSPFCMKLETYLKMAQIEYEVDTTEPMGPKGKMPWITLDGEEVADSELIIQFLNKKYQKNLQSKLTEEEIAIGRSVRIMMEDHAYWGLCLWRYVYDACDHLGDIVKLSPLITTIMRNYVSRLIKGSAFSHGLGRHSKEDVIQMTKEDLKSVANILGKKKYLLTDDEATEVDCAVFGMVAQFMWNAPESPFEEFMMSDEMANLREYCDRMNDVYWKDWEEKLNK